MMLAEIIGGTLFGSMAVVADGWHMSTHAGALAIVALAYRFAGRHARDPKFSFGTGKMGELAAFSSALLLALVAVLIGYEALRRLYVRAGNRRTARRPVLWMGVARSGHGASGRRGDPELVVRSVAERRCGALDMQPDRELPGRIRQALEVGGDRVSDLHLWRLGPGHFGLIAAVVTDRPVEPTAYKARLGGISALSHVTIEVHRCPDHTRKAA